MSRSIRSVPRVKPKGMLHPPAPAFHRDARRVHDLHFNAMRQQIPRDPEPVATCFVGQYGPAHGSAGPLCLRLPSFDLLQQACHLARCQPSTRPARYAGQHCSDFPSLATQFQCQYQRAIVIEGGRGCLLCHCIVPYGFWTTARIHAAAIAHPHSILTRWSAAGRSARSSPISVAISASSRPIPCGRN
jgi:hypothetical protein